MIDLIERIEGWAEDKGIFKSSNGLAQATKTIEELGELASAIGDNDLGEIKDAIGDITVTLVIQAKMLNLHINLNTLSDGNGKPDRGTCLMGLTESIGSLCALYNKPINITSFYLEKIIRWLEMTSQAYHLDYIDCVESAYIVISKRRGEMINGMFVKEGE